MTDSAKAAVQKITAAFNDRSELCGPFDDDWVALCLAAALRAAADEVVPAEMPEGPDCCLSMVEAIRRELLAIAAELETQP